MLQLDRGNLSDAFVLFTLATEHGMELGNLGLALLHNRQNNKDLAAAALAAVALSSGIPHNEIPLRSFLIYGGLWENLERREQVLREFLSIDPDLRDVKGLLDAGTSG